MSTLAARLKALAKQGKELPPEVLEQLEALLPPVRRGRPKQRDIVLHLLRFYVDGLKGLGTCATDKEALQMFLRRHVGRHNLKTWQNKLARARKLLK